MNCERYKVWMTDAATDGLSARGRAEFEAHVRVCAACREEFARVRALVEAIDHRTMAQPATEPSPEFLGRVRQRIAAEGTSAKVIWASWVPATACAAMILVALAIWMTWPRDAKPHEVVSMKSASNSLTAANRAAPNTAGAGSQAVRANPAVASVCRAAAHSWRQMERSPEVPEVIIQPGQSEAVLQFAAALQSGKLDGAKLLVEQKKAEQPIEIKPLVILPLEGSAQADRTNSGPGGSGSENNFVSGEPTRGFEP